MKHISYIIIACTVYLCGCKKLEPVDNPMLIRGAEGRMWLYFNSESENLQYL
jgi:hypothetical protein